MDLGLGGRRAVVAGGSDGAGLATARILAAEGARVAVMARRPEGLERAAESLRSVRPAGGREGGAGRRRPGGPDVPTIPADVTDEAQVQRAIAQVLDAWGGIDVLVNAAGQGYRRSLTALSVGEWEQNWAALARPGRRLDPGEQRVRVP